MGKKGGGGEAAAARADEQARQERIRQGTQRINSIFDGRTIGSGKLTAGAVFDPNAKYYLEDGSVWSPTTAAPAAPAAPAPAAPARTSAGGWTMRNPDNSRNGTAGIGTGRNRPLTQEEQAQFRRTGVDPRGYENQPKPAAPAMKSPAEQFAEALSGGKLYSATDRTGGFGDEFFNKQRQNYIDYATPQLEDQKGEASKQLTFALSRSGLLNSSARAQKEGDLQKTYDLNKQKIADDALSYETQARNNVEDARSNLIATLNATGDAEGAAQSAIHRAAALSQPAAYSPLSNLFADFTSALGTQAALEKANYYSGGQTGVRYNTGLFGPKNAVKVS